MTQVVDFIKGEIFTLRISVLLELQKRTHATL